MRKPWFVDAGGWYTDDYESGREFFQNLERKYNAINSQSETMHTSFTERIKKCVKAENDRFNKIELQEELLKVPEDDRPAKEKEFWENKKVSTDIWYAMNVWNPNQSSSSWEAPWTTGADGSSKSNRKAIKWLEETYLEWKYVEYQGKKMLQDSFTDEEELGLFT